MKKVISKIILIILVLLLLTITLYNIFLFNKYELQARFFLMQVQGITNGHESQFDRNFFLGFRGNVEILYSKRFLDKYRTHVQSENYLNFIFENVHVTMINNTHNSAPGNKISVYSFHDDLMLSNILTMIEKENILTGSKRKNFIKNTSKMTFESCNVIFVDNEENAIYDNYHAYVFIKEKYVDRNPDYLVPTCLIEEFVHAITRWPDLPDIPIFDSIFNKSPDVNGATIEFLTDDDARFVKYFGAHDFSKLRLDKVVVVSDCISKIFLREDRRTKFLVYLSSFAYPIKNCDNIMKNYNLRKPSIRS